MPVITVRPNSSIVPLSSWLGFPLSADDVLWQNIDEGVYTADDDASFVFAQEKLNDAQFSFNVPNLGGRNVTEIRILVKWRPEGLSDGRMSAFAWHGESILGGASDSTNNNGYLVYSFGNGNSQTPPSTDSRFAVNLTQVEAEEIFVSLIDDSGDGTVARITALEVEFVTEFVEEGSGGSKLGGVAAESFFRPLKSFVLKPVETLSQLNYIGSPETDPDLFHLNVDDDILNCPEDGFSLPQAQTRLYKTVHLGIPRVKFRFGEFPVLEGEETIVGIVCSGCGQSEDFVDVQAELFIAHTGEPDGQRIVSIIELLGFIPGQGIKTSLNFDFFDPDVDGKNALHQALLDAQIEPSTVDWNETHIQFGQPSGGTGTSSSLFWFSAIVWVGLLDPIASGGMKAGGVSKSGVSIAISGGAVVSGEASVNGSTTEQGSGGIVVLPLSIAFSTETRFIGGGIIIPPLVLFVDVVTFYPPLKSDTAYFLSGGPSNGDPLLSLGGERSIASADSNLFDDFKPEETAIGLEDYRCIYVVNDLQHSLRDIRVWVEINPLSDTVTTFGVHEANDVQEVTLEFYSESGSFTVDFSGNDVVVNADPDLGDFAQNFQDALRSSTSGLLTDVTVSTRLFEDTVTFVVLFAGADGKKEQPVFALKSNDLVENPSISIEKTVFGSPINATAEIVATDTTVPINPNFEETTQSSPIVVSALNSNEGFPLWIRRTVLPNPDATQNDGFSLRVHADIIPIAIA